MNPSIIIENTHFTKEDPEFIVFYEFCQSLLNEFGGKIYSKCLNHKRGIEFTFYVYNIDVTYVRVFSRQFIENYISNKDAFLSIKGAMIQELKGRTRIQQK